MNRDPFYEDVVDGLAKLRDREAFEQCVGGLLRREWPNLLPVPGGDDAGVDGAWVDEHGRGLLIATTAKDVVRNVTKSLRARWSSGQR